MIFGGSNLYMQWVLITWNEESKFEVYMVDESRPRMKIGMIEN
jgi:hypothetical protein